MKVKVATGAITAETAPLLAVLVTKDKPAGVGLPAGWKSALDAPIKAGDFKGNELQNATVYPAGRRVMLIGLGKASAVTLDVLRRAGGAASRRARTLKVGKIALVSCGVKALDAGDQARALAEGLVLGSYRYHGEKTSKASPEVTEAKVHFAGRVQKTQRDGIAAGQAIGMAQHTARDLGNHPSNILTPAKMASRAQAIARAGKLRCKVVRGAELKRRKFGGLLGVAAGSKEPPAFIEMEYRPSSFKKTICLVGKGVTFDTGGISIKPSAKMEDMKFDMCGAAAVLGAMQALGQLRPKGVRVYGLIPTTSNMPGSNATKPGDVLRSYGGITMEVINTDAEGRLVLADALGRAQELKPDYCVDLATLTGAVVVALGHRATGLFCQDDELAQALHAAGEHTHERMWRLPLWDEFLDEMKSSVADIKNSGSRWGGACTAAAFLKKFAGDLKWAHLDIAGTAWDVPKNELYASGASGVGVRCLVRWIEQIAG